VGLPLEPRESRRFDSALTTGDVFSERTAALFDGVGFFHG
jgi:hypothetical protein